MLYHFLFVGTSLWTVLALMAVSTYFYCMVKLSARLESYGYTRLAAWCNLINNLSMIVFALGAAALVVWFVINEPSMPNGCYRDAMSDSMVCE